MLSFAGLNISCINKNIFVYNSTIKGKLDIISKTFFKMKRTPCIVKQFSVSSPIGRICVEYCESGLHGLNTPDKGDYNQEQNVIICDGTGTVNSKTATEVVSWLQLYFMNPRTASETAFPSLCENISQSGPFRGKVRNVLVANVKAGETISYKKLAILSDNPGAVRAVGSAMSNNPISILVPCHRVIKADGSLGNYAKGTKNSMKEWLLRFESSFK